MANEWWTFPRVDNFGTVDPQGGYWKPDSNIQLPGGYPITALLPGTITSMQNTSYGQSVITIRLDTPLNSLATHTFYEHMVGFAPGLAVGSHVNTGDLIGYNNPSGATPLGFGLYSGDVYGSGPAWQTLQQDIGPGGAGLLNPVNLLNAASQGQLGQFSLPNSYFGGSIAGSSLASISDPLASMIQQLSGLTAWLQNPLRIVKAVVGMVLVALGLWMLADPQGSKQAISSVTGGIAK